MGNGGLTGCSVTDQEAVSVVHPNGYVEYIRKPCNVDDLLLIYPDYFVSRSIIAKNRGLPPSAKLETGQTYFLQPRPGIRPAAAAGNHQFLRPPVSASSTAHTPAAAVPLTFLQHLRVENQCTTSCEEDILHTRRSSYIPAAAHVRSTTSSYNQTWKKAAGVAESYEAAAVLEQQAGWKSKIKCAAAAAASREIESKQQNDQRAQLIRHQQQADHHPTTTSLRSYNIRASAGSCLVKFTLFQDCCATLLPANDHCNNRLLLEQHQKEKNMMTRSLAGKNRILGKQTEYINSISVPMTCSSRLHPYSRRSSAAARHLRRSRSKSWQPVLQSISEMPTSVGLHVSTTSTDSRTGRSGYVNSAKTYVDCCTDDDDNSTTPQLLSYYVDAARQLEISFEAKCSVYTA
ncbi:hypothetical protein CY35_03G057300 [Sphagnum magellanicum]|jgi:hypothetical protein|nr:hypothetical protein CY35_03G057300 [Sphagnum magellanicum]